MMPTKKEFLAAYRAALPDVYAWAADAKKLDRFMDSVALTIGALEGSKSSSVWVHDSTVSRHAWAQIGGKPSAFSLKALRELPFA